MKSFFVVFLALSAAAAADNFCSPGAFFNIDCNWCTCANDGKSAACTDMACSKDNANVNDIAVARPRLSCEPRSVFSPDNCNVCRCSDDGTDAVCTLISCPGTKEAKQICQPGAQFNDYCNVCTCADDGLSFGCTAMYCDKNIWNKDGSLKSRPKISNLARRQICSPNSVFKEDCNTCLCSKDGLNKVCTLAVCGKNPLERRGPVCEPGKAYSPDGCNTCVCNQYGTESACTYRLCLPGLKSLRRDNESEKWGPKYRQGDACTPGKAFYSECNRCVCSDSGRSAFCTLMSCSP